MTSRRACSLVACLGLALAVVVVGAGTGTPPGGAQTAATTLTLVGQSAWTPSGGDFTLRLRADQVPTGTTLALTTHEQVASRNSFDAGLAGGNLGATVNLGRFAFDALDTDPTGTRVLTVPADRLNARLNTRQSGSGVFPLEVDLRSADDHVLARFVTHVVVADVGPTGALVVGQPLRVAWVWPLQSDPAYPSIGADDPPVDPAVSNELLPEGRLGRQVTAIAANLDVPLTLAPAPDTLAAWAELAATDATFATGVAELRSVLHRDQILAGPYVPIDLPSLFNGGLDGAITTQIQTGVSTLENFFGGLPDVSTALPGPLDTRSLAALRNASQRRLVVHGSALTTADEQFTPAQPTTVLANPNDESTAMGVLATDAAIERLLADDDPPALRAAHVLASLAVVAGEQPVRARGVGIVNPARWDAPPELVQTLLAGLRGNPLVSPVTVDTLFAEVPVATVGDAPDGPRLVRQLAFVLPATPPVTASQYGRALLERNEVANLFSIDDPRVRIGDRALLESLSSAWANPAGRRKASALLAGIGASVDGFLARIRVPEQSTVTLTSSTAEIPITFNNNTGQAVRVRIRLDSTRLLFPDGAERVIDLPPKNHTERIRVETRGPGTFPVVVDVTTEGGLPIQTTKLSVRSSVVSGVGVVLMGGALAFLALWWGWDIHRRRTRRVRDDAVGATAPLPA